MAGYLVGGHMTMIRAMIRAIEAAGGEIRLRTPVREVRVEENRVCGVRIDGVVEPFEAAAPHAHPPSSLPSSRTFRDRGWKICAPGATWG